jgi:hypothetical protein
MCASRPLPGSNWFEQARGREKLLISSGLGWDDQLYMYSWFQFGFRAFAVVFRHSFKEASFPFSFPPIVVSSLLHALFGQIVTRAWQFGFIGWVCVVSCQVMSIRLYGLT